MWKPSRNHLKSLSLQLTVMTGFYTVHVISLSLHIGKKQQAVTLKLGGVTVNCQSILRREEELAPLARCIPKDPATRKRFVIPTLFIDPL